MVQSTGKTVVDNLSDKLWYLDSHHKKFKDQHLIIPIPFTEYQGFNDYRKNHKSKAHIQAAELNIHIGSLVSILGMPWNIKNKSSEFRRFLSTLAESMKSYDDFLVGMKQCTAENHSRKQYFEESFGNREIDDKTGPVSPNYLPLQNKLLSKYFYEGYCTFDIQPDDRYKQRLWYENLQLNFSIGVYVHQRKNFLGNLTYVWRIHENNEKSHEISLKL